MNFQIFPSKIEWDSFYTRLFFYAAFGSGFLLVFWMWHLNCAGEVARGAGGYPRIFDSAFFIVWLMMFVASARFASYVKAETILTKAALAEAIKNNTEGIIATSFLRVFCAYWLNLVFLCAGTVVIKPTGGNDMLTICVLSLLTLLLSLTLYCIFTLIIRFNTWSCKRFLS